VRRRRLSRAHGRLCSVSRIRLLLLVTLVPLVVIVAVLVVAALNGRS
jgi:hypothetical protein